MADDDIDPAALYDPKLSHAEFLRCYDRFERAQFKRFVGCDADINAHHDIVTQEEEQTRCTLATCGKEFHKGYWQETSGERNRFCSRKCQRAYHAADATDQLIADGDNARRYM